MTDFTNPVPSRHPLGQDTGGDDERKRQEAYQILRLVAHLNTDAVYRDGDLTAWEARFIRDMQKRFEVPQKGWATGREVFQLRNIKDKLIDRGLI